MHGAAILDLELRVAEVSQSFRVGVLTSGGVPDDVFNRELQNPNIQDQLKHTVTLHSVVREGLC